MYRTHNGENMKVFAENSDIYTNSFDKTYYYTQKDGDFVLE